MPEWVIVLLGGAALPTLISVLFNIGKNRADKDKSLSEAAKTLYQPLSDEVDRLSTELDKTRDELEQTQNELARVTGRVACLERCNGVLNRKVADLVTLLGEVWELTKSMAEALGESLPVALATTVENELRDDSGGG